AEDGIRDKLVTGVQTCALPISAATTRCTHTTSLFVFGRRVPELLAQRMPPPEDQDRKDRSDDIPAEDPVPGERAEAHVRQDRRRSEERRVGKEGSARWAPEK